MMYLGDQAVGIAIKESNILYSWAKPVDWPDLESITLPNSWTKNTVYFLYDKKCGIDDVSIIGQNMNVYKGTVNNGEFVGTQVANSVSKYTDTLTDEYTVYKIEQEGTSIIRFSNECMLKSNYSWANQGCVWIYGEVPTLTAIGGDSGCSILTPYMRRINFSHVQHMYFTYPENASNANGGCPWDISVSYVCGNQYPNDWNGLQVNRTGNGPITPPIKTYEDFILKNVNFNNNYNQANITARNVVLINPSGIMRQGQYNYNTLLEKFIVRDGTLKCINCANQFGYAYNLRICDISGIDFSECTSSAGAFSCCPSLETLILNSTWSLPLNIASCGRLTKESLLNIFEVLPTVSTSTRIDINPYLKATLSSTEIEIATNKGWTVN